MKARTLYYCPVDKNELLFEEVYDENCDFFYQAPQELPEVCPKCGRLLFKRDCFTVEELCKSVNLAGSSQCPINKSRPNENL